VKLYAMDSGYLSQYLFALENATQEDHAAARDRFESQPLPDIATPVDASGEATISITGPLSPTGPSAIERFFGFGGTSYRAIIEAADAFREDPSVQRVRLAMHTPGGSVDGADQARAAIARLAAEKEVVAENHGLVASAGYLLASPATKIIAMTPFAETGSIGVIWAGIDTSQALENAGIKRIKIVSSNAPDKHADPSTEHGRSVHQREVDAMERVFIKAVADGRGVTPDYVAQNFGRGGVLIAEDPDPTKPSALKAGMIDGVIGGTMTAAQPGDTTAGPTTFRDFPLIDRPWDSAAAILRVRAFVGATDTPNQRYRQAFFWYNSEESGNFGAYKLPFADVVDGRIVANIRGVNAANGAMSGARGGVQIPEADRPRVQSHIDRYREKWQREQERGGGASASQNQSTKETFMDLQTLKAEHPALFAEAVAVGVDQERERVQAHLTLGAASGDLNLAITSINSGAELTAKLNAEYMAASMRTKEITARGAEAPADPDTPVSSSGAQDEAVASLLAEQLGVEVNG